MRSARFETGRTEIFHTTFTHEGHEIRVHSYGVITITLPEDEPLVEKHERGVGR